MKTANIETVVGGAHYRVPSSDGGAMYNVHYAGSGDGDPEYVALWTCDCAAGRYGRMCKHVRAVAEISAIEPEDY